MRLHRYDRRRANEILRSSEYFKFVFVRNPWSRLVSGFLSKFVKKLWPPGVEIINASGISADSIRFRDFVTFLQSKKTSDFNPHWRPQADFLADTSFDFIGKFENFQEDFSLIARRLSLNPRLPHSGNRTQYTVGNTECVADVSAGMLKHLPAFPPYQFFYTPDLVEIVGSIYREDVATFGYDFGEYVVSTSRKAG